MGVRARHAAAANSGGWSPGDHLKAVSCWAIVDSDDIVMIDSGWAVADSENRMLRQPKRWN